MASVNVECDGEGSIKEKVSELKRKFYFGRQLETSCLPSDVTPREIQEAFSDLQIEAIHVQSNNAFSVAHIVLEDPVILDEWHASKKCILRGNSFDVSPTKIEMMLCVARLPFTFTEAQFSALVKTYGEVCCSFLMINETTGCGKGYGFVKYTTKEAALVAKAMLDGRQIESFTLCCDWLESEVTTFSSLHSTCLYVDRLPKIEDRDEFAKLFSSFASPLYCQVAMINDSPQNWGLVEYGSANDAEIAQAVLNGFNLNGRNIRVFFSIPGKRAINLYLQFLNLCDKKEASSGLMPAPSPSAVIYHFRNLYKHNAIFAKNLIMIIDEMQHKHFMKQRSVSIAGDSSRKAGLASDVYMATVCGQVAPNEVDASVLVVAARILEMQVGNGLSLKGSPMFLATLVNQMQEDSIVKDVNAMQASDGMGTISTPDVLSQSSTEQLLPTVSAASFANAIPVPNMTTALIPENRFPGPNLVFNARLSVSNFMLQTRRPMFVSPLSMGQELVSQSEWPLPHPIFLNTGPIQFEASESNRCSPMVTDMSSPIEDNNSETFEESGVEIDADEINPVVQIGVTNSHAPADCITPNVQFEAAPVAQIGVNNLNVPADSITSNDQFEAVPVAQNEVNNSHTPADCITTSIQFEAAPVVQNGVNYTHVPVYVFSPNFQMFNDHVNLVRQNAVNNSYVVLHSVASNFQNFGGQAAPVLQNGVNKCSCAYCCT